MRTTLFLAAVAWGWVLSPAADAQPSSAPEQVERLFQQATELHKAGEHEKAISYYTKVIELDPNHAAAWFNRGDLYGAQKQYERAITDYRQVNRLSPEFPSAIGDKREGAWSRPSGCGDLSGQPGVTL